VAFAVPRLPRILTHHRAFSACVILSLGVGISAAAAVLAVVDSAKLGPLPFGNAERIEQVLYRRRSDPLFRSWTVPQEVGRAIKAGGSPVVDVAVYTVDRMRFRDRDHAVDDVGARVSPNFATVIGSRMLLGRAFGAADIGVPSAILSYDFWTSKLGSDSSIVGRTIELNDTPTVVTGVAAREWQVPDRVALWTTDASLDDPGVKRMDVSTLVLLEHSADDRDRATISTRATAAYYAAKTWRGSIRPELTMSSMTLRESLSGWLSGVVLILTIIAVFIGLLAAVNFAALVLARGIRRRGEIGVRAALGASVGQLSREIVGECLVLCAASGALAAILAPSFLDIVRESFGQFLPAWFHIALSWRSIAASVVLAVAIGTIFGFGPAFDIARPALVGFLRAASATSSDGGGLARTRSRLVAIQVALATAVLVSLGAVLGKSLLLTRPDSGFAHESVAVGYVLDSANSLSLAKGAQLLDGVRQTPTVAAAALVGRRYVSSTQVLIAGETLPDDSPFRLASVNTTSTDFFRVARPRLIAGRLPTLDEETSGATVIVVTRSLAEQLFSARTAVGRRLRIPSYPNQPLTIIGVIDEIRLNPYGGGDTPTIFVAASVRGAPSAAAPQTTELWLRSAGSITQTTRAVMLRAMQHKFGSGRLVELQSVTASLDRDYRTFRGLLRFVAGVFFIALGLAALGIYGLVAYTAEMRARELAIREAVGASRVHVSGLVLKTAVIQGAIGVAAGAVLATGIIGWLNHFDLKLQAIAGATAASMFLVGVTILVSSIGPLYATWKRDLAQILRV
jgi:putative ABC transport system permease protein